MGPLIGAWKLLSATMENVQTGERVSAWGEHPRGSLILTESARWLVLQTAEKRAPPGTNMETAEAYRSMISYGGSFRTLGNQIFIEVDIAWDESWVRRQQVRFFRLEGQTLHIEAPPQRYPNFGDRLMRGILVWQRCT